ncbi:AAA domain-containing protein [Nitrosomonas oligotropha]|uniref:AAA domain-containing protein n=1 Tax=Nitrosomonas oligotropha TaxID=42354 RepID=A0A2T5I167_9PROT|nr:AAA family ATPase [Nitrosomonas oligotropha]PTQ77575.1 AAA domain-containing protein [Nitrosomonas oligotropha]
MSEIQIEIKNCNNIDFAVISLEERKLNIKFAPNGTGKSTIARAMLLGLKEESTLSELMPFKLRKENPENKQPKVKGAEALKSIMCFNEEYVSQFVFKPEELISNSFDILIRTDAYKQKEQEIEELVRNIKQLFSGNQELESLIVTLKEMGNAFKLSKTGLDKKSTGMRGLSAGNKIEHVPAGLESYTPFIQSQNSVNWIDWQTKGYEFTELSDNCPFCTSHAADKKDQIKRVGQEYDKNTIKNLIAIIGVIEKLGDYFSDEAKERLTTITTLKEGIKKEHEDALATVKKQIDNFTENLERLRTLSVFQFKDGDKVAEKLPAYKLDLQFFSELKSNKMQDAIAPINASIDAVIEQAGQLQGKINLQRSEMRRVIERHQKDINEFLAYAGYRYAVEIAGEGEQAKLKLRHVDHGEHLSGGNQHLSFGERNAFAIVLFMYECLSKKPDLIILDDPISSFDKNKKYAILEMLFRRDAEVCLKSKTVLMLTHDVEPIIDTVKSLSRKFGNQTSASFLRLSFGEISECDIAKDDVQTFSQICKNALASEKDDIVKLIYLRRHFEIADNMGDAYQVLSNLLHKGNDKERGIDTREPKDAEDNHPEMEFAKFEEGCAEISNHLNGFSYPQLLSRVGDLNALRALYTASENGYEKLQIFRLIGDVENSVIQKFINETYHIENEFISQLDPAKFDTIPEYVVAECNKLVNGREE